MKGSALALVAAVVLTSLLPEAAPPAPKQPGSPAPALTPGAGIATLPFYSTADFTAEWIEPGTERYARIHRVAPFSLTNQAGDTVTEQTLRGKIYIANFFFTSCSGICPRMMASLRRLQAALAEDDAVVLVSHTVMPSMDSRAVLLAYAEKNGVHADKWHLLTGEKEVIYDLARRSYFAEKGLGLTKGSDEFLHTENMILVDPQGRIRGIYNATLALEIDRVVEDVQELKREAVGPAPRFAAAGQMR